MEVIICKSCGKELIFKQKPHAQGEYAGYCQRCRDKLKNESAGYFRLCPDCGVKIPYKWKSDKLWAERNNTKCKKCMVNSGKFVKNHTLNDIYNNSENSINNLLQETLESFYWLGFIIADGSLYDNKFDIGLNIKDKDHLEKLKIFLNYSKELVERTSTNSIRLCFSDRHSVNLIKTKFGISNNKTYNPIMFSEYFSKFNTDQIMSLLIGIIDGDGYISKKGNSGSIKITAHKNWRNFYSEILKFLNIIEHINDVNNTNVITIGIYKKDIIKLIYTFAVENTPFLERKWNKLQTIF